jgi:hypothetical protein
LITPLPIGDVRTGAAKVTELNLYETQCGPIRCT